MLLASFALAASPRPPVPQTALQAASANKAVALKASQQADKDPDVVCVSFKEGLPEDWCYAACTNGVCPPEAAKDCMCGKGEPKSKAQQGQQQSGHGKDWASGAILPKETGVAPVDPTLASNRACVAVKPGYTDSWCQTTCGASPTACNADFCNCEAGASQQAQAKQQKAMSDWEEAERRHRAEMPSPDPVAPAQQQAAAAAAPAAAAPAAGAQQAAAAAPAPTAAGGPETTDEWKAAAALKPPDATLPAPNEPTDAWKAAAANTPPQPVTAQAAAGSVPAVSPAAAAPGGLTGPAPTQPTDAWKAAAQASSKPAVALDPAASPAPAADPMANLTPQAKQIIADRDALEKARNDEIQQREAAKTDQERDWTAGAKQAMDQVLKDRDAEIASRTDGTAVPTGAIPAFAKAFFNHQMM